MRLALRLEQRLEVHELSLERLRLLLRRRELRPQPRRALPRLLQLLLEDNDAPAQLLNRRVRRLQLRRHARHLATQLVRLGLGHANLGRQHLDVRLVAQPLGGRRGVGRPLGLQRECRLLERRLHLLELRRERRLARRRLLGRLGRGGLLRAQTLLELRRRLAQLFELGLLGAQLGLERRELLRQRRRLLLEPRHLATQLLDRRVRRRELRFQRGLLRRRRRLGLGRLLLGGLDGGLERLLPGGRRRELHLQLGALRLERRDLHPVARLAQPHLLELDALRLDRLLRLSQQQLHGRGAVGLQVERLLGLLRPDLRLEARLGRQLQPRLEHLDLLAELLLDVLDRPLVALGHRHRQVEVVGVGALELGDPLLRDAHLLRELVLQALRCHAVLIELGLEAGVLEAQPVHGARGALDGVVGGLLRVQLGLLQVRVLQRLEAERDPIEDVLGQPDARVGQEVLGELGDARRERRLVGVLLARVARELLERLHAVLLLGSAD